MNIEDKNLTPSSLYPSRHNLRNKGLRTLGGKLHKGSVKDAYSKLSIGSIPSNYEAIIYHHEEKKGFGTGEKRFYNVEKSELIGGQPDLERQSPSKQIQANASFSKKGYGPLIARQPVQWRVCSQSPALGKYLEITQQPKAIKSYKKAYLVRQKQDQPRKVTQDKQNDDSPGPGSYDLVGIDSKHKYQGCRSAFITKMKRQTYLQTELTPGPGCYSPGSMENKEMPKRQILENELFMQLSKDHSPKTKHFVPKKKESQLPGPGYYDYAPPNFKPLYQRAKFSNTFVQQNRNRFNDPIQAIEKLSKSPSPCSYTLASNFDKIQKKLIDTSSFMSQSKRQPFLGKGLGPNLASLSPKSNSNFHFNIRGQWL